MARSWTWTVRRAAISAFVAAHVAAVTLFVMPACPLKERFGGWVGYYLLPLGLWQEWGMFSPEPARQTLELEAVVRDAHGLRHTFAFPHCWDQSPWRGPWIYRHAKFAHNLSIPGNGALREFAARHAIRGLGLGPADFPVELDLVYRVRISPPFGADPTDAPLAAVPSLIDSYRFETPEELDQ